MALHRLKRLSSNRNRRIWSGDTAIIPLGHNAWVVRNDCLYTYTLRSLSHIMVSLWCGLKTQFTYEALIEKAFFMISILSFMFLPTFGIATARIPSPIIVNGTIDPQATTVSRNVLVTVN